jgi:exopolysaccharide biosynthesis predicted pyruvyltransferase EpsI
MVYYYLIESSDTHIIYEYYPENDKSKAPGIITVDKIAETIELTKPAEMDFEGHSEEFGNWYWYYDHARRHIIEDYEEGTIKSIGMAAWY